MFTLDFEKIQLLKARFITLKRALLNCEKIQLFKTQEQSRKVSNAAFVKKKAGRPGRT